MIRLKFACGLDVANYTITYKQMLSYCISIQLGIVTIT